MENLQNQNLGQSNLNQPIIPKQKKQIPSWVGFVIIIGFAVVIFGGVFAYQYFIAKNQPVIQPPQLLNQTANWKTYTNDQYGFEIKYPINLSLKTQKQESLSEEIITIEDNDSINPAMCQIIAQLNKYAKGTSEEWATAQQKYKKEADQKGEGDYNLEISDVKIGGLDVKKIYTENLNDVKNLSQNKTNIFFRKSGVDYYLSYFNKLVQNGKEITNFNYKICDEIFSTFKFTTPVSQNIQPWQIPGGKNVDDCITYGLLKDNLGCYNKHCVKISPELGANTLIGKTIIGVGGAGMWWKFINDKNVLITRGHSADSPAVPDQIGTWEIKNGEIVIQDPFIKNLSDQYSFKNLQFFDCGSGKIEGVAIHGFWMNDGSGYKEQQIEYRIKKL